MALAEADVFIGTASSHYSVVAATLRYVRGKAPLPSPIRGHARARWAWEQHWTRRRSPLQPSHAASPPTSCRSMQKEANGHRPSVHTSGMARAVGPSVRTGPAGAPASYADEVRLSRGAYAIGLLHSANLSPNASIADKTRRWQTAAQRMQASATLAAMIGAGIMGQQFGQQAPAVKPHCAVSLAHGVRWRHAPGPSVHISRTSFECALAQLQGSCPLWAATSASLEAKLRNSNRTVEPVILLASVQ